MGEVAHRVIRKNEGNQSDLPLTISAQHGLVDQRDYFNSQVASRDMSGYYLLENGEFAYNKSTSADSPWGAIKRLTKYEKGCLSTLYICFRLDQGDPEFLVTYYETNRWHGAVQMIAAEGARNHGLLNIAPDDFFETALTLPCSTEEQRQIGCFFTQLNSLITLHQCKCQHCSLCGYLSWEQRKLGELYSLVSEKNDLTFGRESIISVANMYFNANVNVTDEQYLRTYNVMRLGDIAFEGHSNKEFSHGRFVENYIGDGIVSHIFTVLRPRVPFDVNYWRYAINNEKLMRLSLIRSTKASTMMHDLVPSDFLREAIPTPTLAEQMRIGTFFVGLDNLITLHR
ncbi:restriction endonuclease subunit S [Eggerthella lenta]|uniref:restriction endonuclease subunit S n=1 Tax=Eggerthella lenta TaxID=84112 RepID=UPI0018DD76C0|nr:restriction endonuclease subunit S [Eggerthella lenta]